MCVNQTARLCGRFPFSSDTAAKLEEVIASGKLTFSEIEWINVSDMGECCTYMYNVHTEEPLLKDTSDLNDTSLIRTVSEVPIVHFCARINL